MRTARTKIRSSRSVGCCPYSVSQFAQVRGHRREQLLYVSPGRRELSAVGQHTADKGERIAESVSIGGNGGPRRG
ncbi:MAG TPA: hypothetical protein VK823_08070 [Streptosporangiaceae bacterium]|nr:hypothetical protein [Streptosporangiaceae bacterium]